MHLHKSPLTLVGILLAATAVGMTSAHNGIQATQVSNPIPFLDDDGDGLDNALEARLGTNFADVNADDDSLTDLCEVVLGTNPLVTTASGSLPALAPAARLEAYQVGSSFVLQSFLLRKQKVQSVHFYISRKDPAQLNNPFAAPMVQRLGSSVYGKFMDRYQTLPFSGPGYAITSMRVIFPAAPFVQSEAFSIAVVAVLDQGVKVVDEVRFTTMNGLLVEWRDEGIRHAGSNSLQGGSGSSSGHSGGLFPADPGVGIPLGENLANQVCVQTLGAVGLHGLGVIYGITDADCDTLFGAVCLSSCQQSAGGTFVGLDLPSLLQ